MLKIDHPLMWSYAGPWYWEIQQLGAPTGTLEGRMRASAACGFNCLPLSVQTLNDMNDVDLDKLFDLMQELNLTFHPALHLPFLNSTIDEMKVFAENWENSIPKFKKFFGGNMTSSGLGAGHRFKRDMTVSEKFKKLSPNLAVIAKVCADANYPLAVENHGDFYCSEFASLCDSTPNLYIFLDTGNTYLIGERPVEAFEAAAPYTIGTHFKDHYVKPNPGTLHFEIDGAPLGDGDVELKKCYDILMKKAPRPNELLMEVELVVPQGSDPVACMEQSIKFINSLK